MLPVNQQATMAGVDGGLHKMFVVAEIFGQGQLAVGVVRESLQHGCKLLVGLGRLAKRVERHAQFNQTVRREPLGTGQCRLGRCLQVVYPVFRPAFAAL